MRGLQYDEILDFSGGMHTVKAPHLISKNECVYIQNCDIRDSELKSMNEPLPLIDMELPYFYEFKSKLYQYGDWRSNVLWDNTWYWSDGASIGKVLPDGTELELGINSPVVAPDLDTSRDGRLQGTYKYCYTYYDNNHGIESAPSPLTEYVEVDMKKITINNFSDPLEDNVTHYRIYRIGGLLPYFALVDEIPISQKEYIDFKDDTQIDGRELQTLRCNKPPFGIYYLTEYNGRLFGAEGSKLYFSAKGNPDSWYVYDWLPFPDVITGIAKTPGGLLVMGRHWTYSLMGNDPRSFTLNSVSNIIGCKHCNSIAYINDKAVWLSDKGIAVSNGFSIELITQAKIEQVSDFDPLGAFSTNDRYFLAIRSALVPKETLYPSESLFPLTSKGVSDVEQGVIMIDFKRGNGYSYQVYAYPTIAYISNFRGEVAISMSRDEEPHKDYVLAFMFENKAYREIYFTPSNYLYPSETLYPRNLLSYGDVSSDKPMLVKYISPVFDQGSESTLKEYDKVRVVANGDFTIEIIFNNNVVVNTYTISSDIFKQHILGIPNIFDKSNYIRFKIEGYGTIKSIQWSYVIRDNY